MAEEKKDDRGHRPAPQSCRPVALFELPGRCHVDVHVPTAADSSCPGSPRPPAALQGCSRSRSRTASSAPWRCPASVYPYTTRPSKHPEERCLAVELLIEVLHILCLGLLQTFEEVCHELADLHHFLVEVPLLHPVDQAVDARSSSSASLQARPVRWLQSMSACLCGLIFVTRLQAATFRK